MNPHIQTRFEKALAYTLNHEGGRGCHPRDGGGETHFGISKKWYPNLNIAHLTYQDALLIYKQDFWDPYPYEHIIDPKIAIKIFDLSVNIGPNMAHRLIQRALRASVLDGTVVEDGRLGPKTISAINHAFPHVLLASLKSEAAGYYRSIARGNSTQKCFLTGWLNRAYSEPD